MVRLICSHKLYILANKNSGKIQQLKKNPKVGLCFYWDEINLQITVEGIVAEADREISSEIWNQRDHQANLQSWAIDLSSSKNGDNLDAEKQLAREKFQESRLPLADSWSAYAIQPKRIEMWQTQWRKGKKHICYTLRNNQWLESNYFY